jgi:hypothetical protein
VANVRTFKEYHWFDTLPFKRIAKIELYFVFSNPISKKI